MDLTSLDITVLAAELSSIKDAKVEKIYHRGSDLVIKLYYKKTNLFIRVKAGSFICLTDYREKNEKPSNFAMLLRKYLNRSTLKEIKQLNHERIVDMVFEASNGRRYILVCELFSKGNLILCEASFNIIFALKRQTWSGRAVQKGKKYVLPPPAKDPFKVSRSEFESMFKDSGKSVVKFLASDLSLGGKYAEEICARANIDKNLMPSSITTKELNSVFKSFSEVLKIISSMKLKPNVVNGVPYPFEFLTADGNAKYFDTFNQAVDYVYLSTLEREVIKKKVKPISTKLNSLKRVLEEQQRAYEYNKQRAEKYKKIAELIYLYYDRIQSIVNSKDFNNPLVLKYDKKFSKIYLNLEGQEVKVDLTKTLNEVASDYFEFAKRFKSKAKGALAAMNETKRKIADLSSEEERVRSEIKPLAPVRKKWYEKFRWFMSSEGFLVVSGKDASTNELLIRKHLDDTDLVLHADIAGSPFTVVKDGKMASSRTIQEAAVFTASFSRAWRQGLASIDVYWVNPNQITKHAPSGEYIPRGAFMIYGKKNYLKNTPLELYICADGVFPYKKGKCVMIKPGYSDRKDLEKFVLKNIGAVELTGRIPSGGYAFKLIQ